MSLADSIKFTEKGLEVHGFEASFSDIKRDKKTGKLYISLDAKYRFLFNKSLKLTAPELAEVRQGLEKLIELVDENLTAMKSIDG